MLLSPQPSAFPSASLLTRRERLAQAHHRCVASTSSRRSPRSRLSGLLLPVPWLGENAARLAILALTGYALLPILRNTYAGIRSVDPALEDVQPAPSA